MQLTTRIKLHTDPQQFQALLLTMRQFNAACNHVSGYVFEKRVFGKYTLHHVLYYQLKAQFALFSQLVDPKNASRTCSQCQYCEKANRKSQSAFICQACGYAANADYNAAQNIRFRAVVSQPIAASPS